MKCFPFLVFYFNLLLGPIIEYYKRLFNGIGYLYYIYILLSVIHLYWSLNLGMSFFASHMEHAQYFLIHDQHFCHPLMSLWHFFNIMVKWVNTAFMYSDGLSVILLLREILQL